LKSTLLLVLGFVTFLLAPASAMAGAFSGTNGWITYPTTTGGGWVGGGFVEPTPVVKGIKPDGSTVTFASAIKGTPVWSADGSKIVWLASGAIKMASPTGESEATVLSSSAIISGAGTGMTSGSLTISADGTQVAFEAGCDIYVVAALANQSVGASDKVVDGATGNNCASNSSFSTSGALAYVRRADQGGCSFMSVVYVVSTPVRGTPSDGTRLTNTCANIQGAATWSPDGTKLIYASADYSAPDELIRINADNTGKTTLYASTGQAIGPSPAYSPDGTKIVISEGGDSSSSRTLHPLNADGTGATSLSVTFDFTEAATWGPNVSLTPSGGGSSSTTTPAATTTPTTGKPAPGPALKVSDIPAEITLDLGSSTGGSADQPITVEVPCNAPEGTKLESCTVNMTAPAAVMLGQGDGISVRADKKVSIGKATVRAKNGKQVIVVKVKINQRGRKALRINTKITATVGLTAITIANQRSTGNVETTMRLPTQLISPQQGIFASNSTTLNKAGVAFVNRLAKLLPAKPKDMVFIGFADNTGVPGDNRWLGDRRAKAVRDALEARGIEPVQSSIETKAARSPRDDNATDTGRERNRRVSIRITY